MARAFEVTFEIDASVTKGMQRFRGGITPRGRQVVPRSHKPHAFPTASSDRLEKHRVAKFARDALGVFDSLDGILNTGHHRHAGARGKLSRSSFRSKIFHRFWRRADGRNFIFGAGPCKGWILGQEPVARMHGVTARAPRDVHQLIDAEIAFARRRSTDRVGFGGETNVKRGAVSDTINSGGWYAHLAAGSYDANGNFAAIGDEDFFEHSASIDSQGILTRCSLASNWCR